jgi:hypothetical protein
VRAEQGVHLLGGGSPEGWDDMAVRVERQADLAVSEGLHDDPRRNALGQEERGAGVAEVMEALTRESRSSKDGLEAARNGDPVHRRPDRRGEDKATRVVAPAYAGEESLLELSRAVNMQGVQDEGRQRDDAPARHGLWFHKFETAIDALEGMADGDRRALEVEVAPSQAKDLALTETNPKRDEIEGLKPIGPDRVKESSRLNR